MTKYEPKHQWVKGIGLKGAGAEIADSATDHIGQILDKSNITDVVFVASWGAMTYLLVSSGAIRKLIEANAIMTEGKYSSIFGSTSLASWGLNIGEWLVNRKDSEVPKVDENVISEILLAMVISYFVLTQGVDIAKAVGILGGKV